MRFFNRQSESAAAQADVVGPFQFRIEDMFTVTGKGRLFTGTVESGTVVTGAAASLVIGDSVVLVQVARVETRRRRAPAVLEEGTADAIGLDGLRMDQLPTKPYGGQVIVDIDALKGGVIRSRLASDVPPAGDVADGQ